MNITFESAAIGYTLLCLSAACGASTIPSSSQTTNFEELKASHTTVLTQHGPIANKWPESPTPEGASQITYQSGELSLWAWVAWPEGPGPHPALVYLHGDRYLQASDWDLLKPFLDAGVAVMTPTLRGRNGNAGNHELLYGEVDDALAAVAFMADDSRTNPETVYLVGHSMGGATAALASLHSAIRATHTASIGGIYSDGTFAAWQRQGGEPNLVPFDTSRPDEVVVRLFPKHVADLKVEHIAYVGDKELKIIDNAEKAARGSNKLSVHVVPGGHMGARKPALADFLQRISQ